MNFRSSYTAFNVPIALPYSVGNQDLPTRESFPNFSARSIYVSIPVCSRSILQVQSICSTSKFQCAPQAVSTSQLSTITTTCSTVATTSGISSSPRPVSTVLTILSTIVGICVLIGSLLYKLPQVIRVIRRKSAQGISVLMYTLETLGTSFSALYFARRAFPFSTYGETVFIMIQNVILLALIVVYQRLPRVPAIVLGLFYFTMVIALLSPLVPLSMLVLLQLCSIPILNLARVPQIVLNYRCKATGELSPITLGLQLLGNVARIFTTVAQVKDPLMFVSICVATCFNSVLFGQWLYYSHRSKATIAL